MTFFGYSGPGEPRVLITGFKGCRGFKDNKPAEAANSRKRWEKPEDDELLLPSLLPLEEWWPAMAPTMVSVPFVAPPFAEVILTVGCNL